MTIKVLIVDDEPINVKLIKEILEYEEDFHCRSAVNGEETFEIIDSYHPDIIILDIMMPGMNGYEVCKRIKAHKDHKFTKVLMVSGKVMVEERLEGYAAGADDYVTKPFVDDELLAKLKVFSKLKKTEEVEELKTAILQLFSHETKTPLNGILLGSQLIIDSPNLPKKITEYATLIKLSGERIHDLVRKILLLSTLKNDYTLQLSRQSVLSFLSQVASREEHEIPGNCTLSATCPSDFTLEADWKLLHRSLSAAIANALRNSPDNGAVTVTASRDDDVVRFVVHDLGPSYNSGRSAPLFDAFSADHITNHTQGMALSLAISKEIIELHQGTLTIECGDEDGNSLIFTLPSAAVKARSTAGR